MPFPIVHVSLHQRHHGRMVDTDDTYRSMVGFLTCTFYYVKHYFHGTSEHFFPLLFPTSSLFVEKARAFMYCCVELNSFLGSNSKQRSHPPPTPDAASQQFPGLSAKEKNTNTILLFVASSIMLTRHRPFIMYATTRRIWPDRGGHDRRTALMGPGERILFKIKGFILC